ncbi:SGNH hydrolase [Trametes versicolor FP-101664 SS1]|uniref:SGNH hydrolase n=1 Tax=Trametes versicolor (strain FP-101664) TaxID=717944 RepID=UPI0004621AD9|nr:SGNH hydrolase [Trametes versicolor FP-101664 SS1]EIW60751.1 SGNH hydrolase [Trametes versicolor FP-101664 SS1]
MTAYVQDAIVLLGDSITQFAASPDGLATKLTEAYSRKMDVINRGLSGYNTDWITPVFEQCFPTQHEAQHAAKTRLLVIWLGANDAALPHSVQHVPLARYEANLAALVRAVRSPESPRYSPDTRVVLLTPPPVQPARWAAALAGFTGSAVQAPDRSLEESRRYAEGVRAVAGREGVAVADVWGKIWEAAGGDEERVGEFLVDGLHLNGKGYQVAYDALIAAIEEKYPEYHYDRLRMVFPEWSVIAENVENYRELAKKRSAFGN